MYKERKISMSAELVVMAAGMGSRFGGLKQAAPIGPNGEMIIDLSVYDAKKAGFDKAIFIIRKEIEEDFRAACGKRIEKMIDVEYVYQEKDSLPEGYSLPDGRLKPWGTGHAVLCAKDAVKKPFLIINADDYYGQSVYKTMYDYLVENNEMCMAGYHLGNTLSENGTVSRGICRHENGYLIDTTETHEIGKDTDIPYNTIVSMNMWGLDVGIFDCLEREFKKFLDENINDPKKEFYIAQAINTRMKDEGKKLRILETKEQWHGVTYSADTEAVRKAVKALFDKGLYN